MIETTIGATAFILGFLLGKAVLKKTLRVTYVAGGLKALELLSKETQTTQDDNVIQFKTNRDKD